MQISVDQKTLKTLNMVMWIAIPLLIYQNFKAVFMPGSLLWRVSLLIAGVFALWAALQFRKENKFWVIGAVLGIIAVIYSVLAIIL